MKKVLLSCQGLSVGYRDSNKVLLRNLDLTIHAGELICFMGPNGVGKSTLIRTLTGIQKELSGTISTPLPKIAVVLTDKITATNMTVHDLITYGRYPYLDWRLQLSGDDLQKIEEALQRVGITHLKDYRLYQLSDGQLQMAMVARALAQDTPVLLLDEPTAHLDLNNRVEMMSLLKKLAHDINKGILVATHELDLALQMADRIWLATMTNEVISGVPEDLVLDGSFDQVFKFKGFDLRSGKVQHVPFRKTVVQLKGVGQELLWTRNALERNGYPIRSEGVLIEVIAGAQLTWTLEGKTIHSIAELLEELSKLN